MILGVVGTFKDHRSLALTLQDSEHIARKLGLIIMGVILFILTVRAIGPLVPFVLHCRSFENVFCLQHSWREFNFDSKTPL